MGEVSGEDTGALSIDMLSVDRSAFPGELRLTIPAAQVPQIRMLLTDADIAYVPLLGHHNEPTTQIHLFHDSTLPARLATVIAAYQTQHHGRIRLGHHTTGPDVLTLEQLQNLLHALTQRSTEPS